MSSFYRRQLEDWLKTIDVKADYVIDIGGKDKPVKCRVKSWDVKTYRILDLPQYNLNYPEHYDIEFCDVIFCLEVFDYIWNPVVALTNISDLLRVGGKAYVSFPFIYPQHEPINSDALRYTKQSIYKLAEVAHLLVRDIKPRLATAGRDALRVFYKSELMHRAKGVEHDEIGYLVTFEKYGQDS